MATFLTNLFNSIFTPGPTPTLIVATNASFAALQCILLVFLVATYSVHFVILSFLSAGLWWAINWFVTELEMANKEEKEAQRLRVLREERDNTGAEDSGTETEGADGLSRSVNAGTKTEGRSAQDAAEGALRKRRSLGEASAGELSTDSEWDKVEEVGDIGR